MSTSQPAYCRFDELPAVGPVLGREMVHHDVLLDHLHLHGGAVPHEPETLPPWNLQHDWPHGVNIVTANTSFGESDHTARMCVDTQPCLLFITDSTRGNKDSELSVC